jgi:hypothetical protein
MSGKRTSTRAAFPILRKIGCFCRVMTRIKPAISARDNNRLLHRRAQLLLSGDRAIVGFSFAKVGISYRVSRMPPINGAFLHRRHQSPFPIVLHTTRYVPITANTAPGSQSRRQRSPNARQVIMKIPTQSNNARFFAVSSVLQLEHFIRKSELFHRTAFCSLPRSFTTDFMGFGCKC